MIKAHLGTLKSLQNYHRSSVYGVQVPVLVLGIEAVLLLPLPLPIYLSPRRAFAHTDIYHCRKIKSAKLNNDRNTVNSSRWIIRL